MQRKALPLLTGSVLGALLVAAVWAAESSPPGETPILAVADQPAVSEQDARAGRQLAEDLSLAFEHATELVKPSVVPIYAERQMQMQMRGFGGSPFGLDEEMLRRFFPDLRLPQQPDSEQRGPSVQGVGSGVIVGADGTILTNNHVVQDAERLFVRISDRRFSAELVGADPATDLAVIRITDEDLPKDLPVAQLGSSDNLRVGQWVIAVGNPYELLSTVTAGIVSATGRAAVGLATYEDFIQTDASINPGNSGGALADLHGRVVGINTAISSPTGSNVGIGFAIPIDLAKRIMDDLIEDGEVSRGYLGLLPQDIDENLARALDLESRAGALVSSVSAGEPAAKAGIETGDVIVRFDGKPVTGANQLRNLVADAGPGKTVPVVILRNGAERTLRVELGERPADPRVGSRQPAPERDNEELGRLGLQLQELDPEVRQRLGLDQSTSGVVVVGVTPGSEAQRAGLRRGDLIQRVGAKTTPDLDSLREVLDDVKSGESVALLVRRGDGAQYVAVEVP